MSNTWIKSSGVLRFSNGALRLTLDNDFTDYYRWLLERYYCFKIHAPAHGAHISVWLPTKHRPLSDDDRKALDPFLMKEIKFEYNPDVRVGGFSKPYRNFLIDVRSHTLDRVGYALNIRQPFHITVGNTKGGIRPYIMK